MTNQQILTKAIQKAIDGGWNLYKFMECEGEPTQWRVHDNGVLEVPFVRGGGNMKVLHDYLFDPKFAQALWGQEEAGTEDFYSPKHNELSGSSWPKMWQYHLQQMVVADNRIKYLGENL